MTPRTVEGFGGSPACKVALIKIEKSGTQSLTDFFVILQEIDEAIHGDMGFQISNKRDRKLTVVTSMEVLDMEAELTEQQNPQHKEGTMFQYYVEHVDPIRLIFTPGWANTTR